MNSDTPEEPLPIAKRIQSVMAAMPVIEKTQRNKQQNYNFAGRDDVVGVVRTLLIDHGIIFTLSRLDGEGDRFEASYISTDGGEIKFKLSSLGKHVKAPDTPQAHGSAISYAEKFAHRTMFQIETGEHDPDHGDEDSDKGNDTPPPPPAEPKKAELKGRLTPGQEKDLLEINTKLKISKESKVAILDACDRDLDKYYKVMQNIADEADNRATIEFSDPMTLDEMLAWCDAPSKDVAK